MPWNTIQYPLPRALHLTIHLRQTPTADYITPADPYSRPTLTQPVPDSRSRPRYDATTARTPPDEVPGGAAGDGIHTGRGIVPGKQTSSRVYLRSGESVFKTDM